MRTWQLQEARRRFSEVVDQALADGPQRVTRHGKQAVVVRSSGSDPQMLAGYGLDFHTPYLRAILGFLGITDVHVVQSYGVSPD